MDCATHANALSVQSYPVVTVIPVLQTGKPKLQELPVAQGHPAEQWHSQDLNLALLDSFPEIS